MHKYQILFYIIIFVGYFTIPYILLNKIKKIKCNIQEILYFKIITYLFYLIFLLKFILEFINIHKNINKLLDYILIIIAIILILYIDNYVLLEIKKVCDINIDLQILIVIMYLFLFINIIQIVL
jgi:hypothetical protein